MTDSELAISTRRAIAQYRKQGYELRQLTAEEAEAQAAAVDTPKQLQLPVSDRLVQVRKVNALVAKHGYTKYYACELVGLSYGNYKELSRKNRDKL